MNEHNSDIDLEYFWKQNPFQKNLGKEAVSNVENIIRLILSRAKDYNDSLLREISYILATATWETNYALKPVEEAYYIRDDSRRRRALMKLYRNRSSIIRYRKGKYYFYWGRGFIQLTHYYNYIKYGKKLGIDLQENPEEALGKDASTEILLLWFYWGHRKKFKRLIGEDYWNLRILRTIVNGYDRWNLIAAIAKNVYNALVYKENKTLQTKELLSLYEKGKLRMNHIINQMKGFYI